jgi:hypothetical protein
MQKVFQILRSVLIVFLLPCLLIPRCREESENASEFASDRQTSQGPGFGLGPDALGVQGIQLKRNIHSFDDACV